MARKRTLSPSRITTYLACPSRYMWTYVDDRGRYYLRAKSVFSFGSTLHKVLERFHNSADTGVQTVHQAVAAVEEHWHAAGYSSAAEMQDALGEGKVIVESYVRRYHETAPTAKPILFEKLLRKDLGTFDLIGRIDRVDEHEDGSLEIVDYKSGRADVTDEEVASDLAMACYQLLVREKFPDRTVRATIVSLRSGATGTACMTDDEANEFETDLIRLGEEILHRDYEHLVPSAKPLCARCDFLPLCRKHPEFDLDAVPSIEERW